MRIDTIVTGTLSDEEVTQAKQVYVGSSEQPTTYKQPVPYAMLIASLIASMKPASVLEFGCNAGRNLQELRSCYDRARLKGVDINSQAVAYGRQHFGLDLDVSEENWLASQPDDAFEVAFTISVIDHIPYPEQVLRQLLRITKHYLVLFELAHDRIGKASHNLFVDADDGVKLKPTFRYSYIHDYRQECERKFGAHCILDAKFPIGSDNLLDLYRLYVF